MQKIRLRYRMVLSSATDGKAFSELMKNATSFLQGSAILRILSGDRSSSLANLKLQNPELVKSYNDQLTELAKFYLNKHKPRLSYLMDRHQLKYEKVEAEISALKFEDPISLTFAIYFLTKEYILIASFGHYLLMSNMLEDETSEAETFMVELTENISIHSYRA